MAIPKQIIGRRVVPLTLLLGMAAFTTGCPVPAPGGDPNSEYDRGFNVGFARDDQYWIGFFDSFDTLSAWPVYYQGSTIPAPVSPPYQAGYWDGVWYAYNDGYFTSYRYGFIIGFSEGYDNAFWPDYLAFLASDAHPEYLNGGFGDGYNDGYSEGRIFGAADYEANWPFDWLSALYDYEDGIDLYFEEIDLGTGVYGPVVLYEYGTDPADLSKALPRTSSLKAMPSVRKAVNPDDLDLYRPIRSDAKQELGVMPDTSRRSNRELGVSGTWLDRINSYFAGGASKDSAPSKTRARMIVE